MATYGRLGVVEIPYDADGTASATEEQALLASLAQQKPEHLFVISHGWNNDDAEARDLYTRFFTSVDNVWARFANFDPAKFAIMAIFWPSKKFDDATLASFGGAAAIDGTASVDAAIGAQLDTLAAVLATNPAAQALIEHARAQIPALAVSGTAQDDFVAAIASAIAPAAQEPDPGLDHAIANLGAQQGHETLSRIALTLNARQGQPAGSAGQTGGAADIGAPAGFDPLQSIKNAGLALLNVTTYWTMKERAGLVGRTGVAQTIAKALNQQNGTLNVHLIGHSFGGRLVTAAANALPGGSPAHAATTMTLLQAAYSHYGMAKEYQPGNDGVFRSVLTSGKVTSQIQITHSKHDIAVGLAYPVASAIARQIGEGLWINPFGGMGADGAQATPEAFEDTLGPVGSAYAPLGPGKSVRNLNGDAIITSHGDIAHDEVAYALLAAINAR